MLQKFQKFFEETNLKIILKYDGERKKERFTVILINKVNPNNTLVENTDEPYKIFMNMAKEYGINVSEELIYEYFIIFENLKNELIKKSDENSILIFTSELSSKIEYYISIRVKTIALSYRDGNIEELFRFIKTKV